MTSQLNRQRGAIAIMVAISMLVLLAVVGLALDAGLAYLVKARLNAAVDSAALAGARNVTTGANRGEQETNAKTAALDFFNANIPSNYLLSAPKIVSTIVTFNGGQATIDVRAEAPMPVSIMQVIGFTSLTPVAYAQTVRRDLDMSFVIDTSGSLSGSAATVRSAAKSFLNKFNVTQDRIGMMHFASGAEVDFPLSSARGFDRPAMLKKIDGLAFSGGTASVEGMWHARNQLNNNIPSGSRSTMRVIVFFSDGDPTALGSVINFNSSSDCRDALGKQIPGVIDQAVNTAVNPWVGYGMSDLDSTPFSYISESCKTIRYINKANQVMTKSLPAWYNAHDDKREFPIITNSPRVVNGDLSTVDATRRNVERASRNLAEAVAAKARDEGIVVFTLGMGAALKTQGDYDTDTGEMILKCMANTPDSPARCYNPDKPVGLYCYAATETELTPCFSRLASAILRITR